MGGFGSHVDFEGDSIVLDVTFLGVENVGPCHEVRETPIVFLADIFNKIKMYVNNTPQTDSITKNYSQVPNALGSECNVLVVLHAHLTS